MGFFKANAPVVAGGFEFIISSIYIFPIGKAAAAVYVQELFISQEGICLNNYESANTLIRKTSTIL